MNTKNVGLQEIVGILKQLTELGEQASSNSYVAKVGRAFRALGLDTLSVTLVSDEDARSFVDAFRAQNPEVREILKAAVDSPETLAFFSSLEGSSLSKQVEALLNDNDVDLAHQISVSHFMIAFAIGWAMGEGTAHGKFGGPVDHTHTVDDTNGQASVAGAL